MNLGVLLLGGSWLARWARLGRITRPTVLDIPLGALLISAAGAAFVAPDRSTAFARLYWLVGAAALFYFLVNAGITSLRLLICLTLLSAAALALYFAVALDWTEHSTTFAGIARLGLRLNQWAPGLGPLHISRDSVAALLTPLGPIALALSTAQFQALRKRKKAGWKDILGVIVAGLSGLAILFGILMAEARTSWLALAGTGGVALWWWFSGHAADRLHGRRAADSLFWAGVGAAAVIGCATVILRPQALTAVWGTVPAPAAGDIGRPELWGQLWRLAQDTPFTGGGLGTFPALYSTYILNIPDPWLTHAQNAYLHLLIEMGWLGLISYGSLLGLGVWTAAQQVRRAPPAVCPFVVGGALGLTAACLHGVGDGALVSSRAVLFMLLPAGLALAGDASLCTADRRLAMRLAGLAIAGVIAAGLFLRLPLLAAWHANLGALAFHRVDLAGWPTGQWENENRREALGLAQPALERALDFQPGHRTANHLLGIAAEARRDFIQAAAYLSRAHQADPGHRGVAKALAFSYVWLGDYEKAGALLVHLPEADYTLRVYARWWRAQGRVDLADHAQQMLSLPGWRPTSADK